MDLGKAGYLIMVIVCLNFYRKKGSIVRTMNPQSTEGWHYIELLWIVSLSFQLPVLSRQTCLLECEVDESSS